jgi:hypothetical protein
VDDESAVAERVTQIQPTRHDGAKTFPLLCVLVYNHANGFKPMGETTT